MTLNIPYLPDHDIKCISFNDVENKSGNETEN